MNRAQRLRLSRSFLFIRSADTGGGSGGSSAPAAQEPPQPTGNTLEEKFASAWNAAKDYFKQLSGVMKERDDFQAEAIGAKQRAEKAEGELKTANETVAAHLKTIGEKDSLITGLTTERDNKTKEVSFLENFCKGHGLNLAGVDRTKAIKEVPESGPQDAASDEAIYKQWKSLSGAAKTKFRKENSEALERYAESQSKK